MRIRRGFSVHPDGPGEASGGPSPPADGPQQGGADHIVGGQTVGIFLTDSVRHCGIPWMYGFITGPPTPPGRSSKRAGVAEAEAVSELVNEQIHGISSHPFPEVFEVCGIKILRDLRVPWTESHITLEDHPSSIGSLTPDVCVTTDLLVRRSVHEQRVPAVLIRPITRNALDSPGDVRRRDVRPSCLRLLDEGQDSLRRIEIDLEIRIRLDVPDQRFARAPDLGRPTLCVLRLDDESLHPSIREKQVSARGHRHQGNGGKHREGQAPAPASTASRRRSCRSARSH